MLELICSGKIREGLLRPLSNLFKNLSTKAFRHNVFQKLCQPPNHVLPQFFIKLNRWYQNPF